MLRLILSCQALMVKLLKIKMSLIKLQMMLDYFFLGNILFNSEDCSQTYLIFQPLYRYFKTVTNTNYILSRKSRGLSAENNSVTPELSYADYRIRVKFTGRFFKTTKNYIYS